MIEQVAATAANPALGYAILPGGASEGGLNRTDAPVANRGRDLQSVFGIAIEDPPPSSSHSAFPRHHTSDQSMDRATVAGGVSLSACSSVSSLDQKPRSRRNGEEIHRGDSFLVVTQKGKPALGRVWVSWGPLHPARDGSFGNGKAEHQKFPMDAGSAPTRAFSHHLESQIANFLGYRFSSDGPADFGITLQYQRNPALCHRTTVSGVTTRSACFQPDQHRRARSQKSRSAKSSLGRA